MKQNMADVGLFGARSSGIRGYLRVAFGAFLFNSRRALLARRISSGVCDSTHFLRAISLAALFWLAIWLYDCNLLVKSLI
jgi:hypothetical protein